MNRKNGQKALASAAGSAHHTGETRPNNSGFQSFLKWFKKNERDRLHQNGLNSSSIEGTAAVANTETNQIKLIKTIHQNGHIHKLYDSSDTISPDSSLGLSDNSSSCDSVFSTATTGFAFIPPNQYKPYGNASQPEKLIAPGPITDTYRERLRAHQNAKAIDKQLDLTLRKKYNIFDTDTLASTDTLSENRTNNNHHPYYSDLSLPQPFVSSPTPDLNSTTTSYPYFRRKSSHSRRTVSDSSKDRKSGAYVHVKGKRKAPKPPQLIKENQMVPSNHTGTLSPSSTLARKKRRAPQPPSQPQSPTPLIPSDSIIDEIPTVLNDGLFDDAEIQAIIGGTSTGYTPQMTKPSEMDRITKNAERNVKNSLELNVQCTDTLKLERGILKSNRDSKEEEKTSPACASSISPRPWYKRASTHKDYAIPFKREVTLKTMEKRKNKHAAKEIDSPQLPEVGFSRNSSLFDGFFARVTSHHHDKSDHDNEKRRSAIGIPNISELDREAGEIIEREHAAERDRLKMEREKFFSTSINSSTSVDDENKNGPRISTKDLISKFEETNHIKFTVNNAFIEKADRYFDSSQINTSNQLSPPIVTTTKQTMCTDTENKNITFKNRFQSNIVTTTTTVVLSTSLTPSIFSNATTTNKQSNSDATSKTTTTSSTSLASSSAVQQNQPENNFKPDTNKIIINEKKTWICSYCTLENYNWRVICGACERIKPYDKQATAASASQTPANAGEQQRIRYNNKCTLDQQSKLAQRVDWETKAEKVIKYFRPKTNTLTKSASETSVSYPSKKASSSSKLLDSPKLGTKPKRTCAKIYEDIVRPSNTTQSQLDTNITQREEHKNQTFSELIDSSAVTTTVASVFTAPFPAKHDEPKSPKSDFPNIEEMRAVRIAKFSEPLPKEDVNLTSSRKEKEISDPNELERVKEKLRETIRKMHARAMVDKYPVVNKTEDPPDVTKLGAIKKIPNRKVELSTDKEIADNFNFNSSKIDMELYSKVSTSVQTSAIKLPPKKADAHLLPSPIIELNEDDPSPSHSIDRQFNVIYAGLKSPPDLEQMSQKLNTAQGLEDFKATLKTSSKQYSSTNTLALNKILKNLEVAIENGQHKLAAKLAMDLAKMKVSLSVTKQQQEKQQTDRLPVQKSSSDKPMFELPEPKTIMVDMFVEDKNTHKGPIHLSLQPTFTVLELKQKIHKDFDIPIDMQRWILNNNLAIDDKQILSEFQLTDKSITYLYIITPAASEEPKITVDIPPPNDTKISNIIEVPVNVALNHLDHKKNQENTANIPDDERGAKALPLLMDNPMGTLKIGWTCPLCTLINSPNRPGCVACSETRPANYIVPKEYRIQNTDFEMPEELRKFLADEDMDELPKLPKPQMRNDLNKTNGSNRKSAEIFNIIVPAEIPKQQTVVKPKEPEPKLRATGINSRNILNTPIVMTAITASPNITKNKYRGVDNYNPHVNKKPEIMSLIPSKSPMIKPVRTSLLLKPLEPPKVVTRFKKLPSKIEELAAMAPIVNNSIAKIQPVLVDPSSSRNSKHYSELLSLDNSDIVTNSCTIECPVCMVEYKPKEGVVLRDCLHTFCRECLINTVRYSDEAEVKCPFSDNQYSCDSFIQEREIRALVTKEEYDNHLAISLKVAEHRIENAFHCKTPSCRGWCIFEDNVNQFKCPICKITNCLTCRVIHDGLNCKQYQDRMNSDCDSNIEARRTREMLADMIDKGDAMNCPICQVVLMKKWGCDWLKCSMCKTEICWVTRGIRWGPEGKGDTSAGCKCGVNGVKCHPKCNYCH